MEVGKFARSNLDHAPVIFQGMQTRPGEDIASTSGVAVTAADACATRPPDESASYLAVLREKVPLMALERGYQSRLSSKVECSSRKQRAALAPGRTPFDSLF